MKPLLEDKQLWKPWSFQRHQHPSSKTLVMNKLTVSPYLYHRLSQPPFPHSLVQLTSGLSNSAQISLSLSFTSHIHLSATRPPIEKIADCPARHWLPLSCCYHSFTYSPISLTSFHPKYPLKIFLSTVFIFLHVPLTDPACCTVSLPLACYTRHLSCPSPLWYSVLSTQLTLLGLLWRWKHQVAVKHWYLFTNIHDIISQKQNLSSAPLL